MPHNVDLSGLDQTKLFRDESAKHNPRRQGGGEYPLVSQTKKVAHKSTGGKPSCEEFVVKEGSQIYALTPAIETLVQNSQSVEIEIYCSGSKEIGAAKVKEYCDTNRDLNLFSPKNYVCVEEVTSGGQLETILGQNACKQSFIILKFNEVVLESFNELSQYQRLVGNADFRLT